MPAIGKHPQSTENPLNDYLHDVQKISEYKIRFVFPGHGPVFNSVKLRTAEIIGYHELKKRNIIKILNEGLKTAFQVASSISWESDNKSMSYSELPTRERRSAIFKTLAYIHLLTADRKIGRIKQNSVFMYLPVV
jgi:glyoxylase-like metal-dependent hydrolase (beta-lactamase superfamily II)